MKIGDFIKFGRENNLGRKGLKKRIRDLKKSNYGDGWQSVNEQFYEHIGILEQRPLLHKKFFRIFKKNKRSRDDIRNWMRYGNLPDKI